MSKVKKEHYVPQNYLRRFSNSSDRITVYDITKNEYRKNQSIRNIACIKYYYDFNDEEIAVLKKDNDFIQEQFIEKMFANDIESNFKAVIDILVNTIDSKYEEYTLKLNEDFKINIAVHIAYQLVRTRCFRENINDIIGTWFPFKVDFVHKNLIIDNEYITKLAQMISNFKWGININRTPVELVISDNPVVLYNMFTWETFYENPSFNNFNAIAFPISPKIIITIFKDSIYEGLENVDIEFLDFDQNFIAHYYNSLQFKNTNGFIYFSGNELSPETFSINTKLISDELIEKYDEEIDILYTELTSMLKTGEIDATRNDKISKRLKEISDDYLSKIQ